MRSSLLTVLLYPGNGKLNGEILEIEGCTGTFSGDLGGSRGSSRLGVSSGGGSIIISVSCGARCAGAGFHADAAELSCAPKSFVDLELLRFSS